MGFECKCTSYFSDLHLLNASQIDTGKTFWGYGWRFQVPYWIKSVSVRNKRKRELTALTVAEIDLMSPFLSNIGKRDVRKCGFNLRLKFLDGILLHSYSAHFESQNSFIQHFLHWQCKLLSMLLSQSQLHLKMGRGKSGSLPKPPLRSRFISTSSSPFFSSGGKRKRKGLKRREKTFFIFSLFNS